MKSTSDINAYIAQNGVDAWRNLCQQYNSAAGAIESAYARGIDHRENPKDTLFGIVKEVGYDLALSIFASLIIIKNWDGRIRPDTAAWAAKQDDIWDLDSVRCLGFMYLGDSIHTAHLEQLGRAFMDNQQELAVLNTQPKDGIASEKEYLLTFAKENAEDLLDAAPDEGDVLPRQFRALWTAYALHHDLEPDTAKYDAGITDLWNAITDGHEVKRDALFNGFDPFDLYMGNDLS